MADLTPNNREEHWLQGMVDGQTTLEPNKRREYWYKEIVDAIGSGGGGGTGGGVLIATATKVESSFVLDKTWNEISNAPFALVKLQMQPNATTYAYVSLIENAEDTYIVYVAILSSDGVNEAAFSVSDPNGYPSMQMG